MKLIDKTAVMAEIENLLDKGKYHEEYDCAYRDGNNGALYALKGKLDTLEVKGIDLEKEIKDYFNNQPIVTRFKGTDYKLVPNAEKIAKYFFELGLKAREVHQFRGFWSESVYQEVLNRFNKQKEDGKIQD